MHICIVHNTHSCVKVHAVIITANMWLLHLVCFYMFIHTESIIGFTRCVIRSVWFSQGAAEWLSRVELPQANSYSSTAVTCFWHTHTYIGSLYLSLIPTLQLFLKPKKRFKTRVKPKHKVTLKFRFQTKLKLGMLKPDISQPVTVWSKPVFYRLLSVIDVALAVSQLPVISFRAWFSHPSIGKCSVPSWGDVKPHQWVLWPVTCSKAVNRLWSRLLLQSCSLQDRYNNKPNNRNVFRWTVVTNHRDKMYV